MKQLDVRNEDFPINLLKIKDPPQKIYALGNTKLLNNIIISIIGSRAASANGKNIAQKFANELSSVGVTVASGLAKGVDSAAHWGAISNKGKTIAVLPSGFNNIYPKENKFLFEEILRNDGCVISEYEPNETAESYKFIRRNRIVSGISVGICVIEAAYRSGTSITAKMAQNQGKEVYCLPHDINDLHGVGTNKLIKNGAKLITSSQEIIKDLNYKFDLNLKTNKLKKEHIKESGKNKDINYNFMNNTMKEIFRVLENGELTITEISYKLKKDIMELNSLISLMELEGVIIQIGEKFKINV